MEFEIDRESIIKKMAQMMRGGAALLAESCPICGSPLLRLPSGEVVCPVHGKVMIAKTEEEVAEASVVGVLTELEKAISAVLNKYVSMIKRGETSSDIARDVIYWLDALERIERVKGELMARRAIQEKQKK